MSKSQQNLTTNASGDCPEIGSGLAGEKIFEESAKNVCRSNEAAHQMQQPAGESGNLQAAGGDYLKSVQDVNNIIKNDDGCKAVLELETEILKTSSEPDNVQKKVEETEKQISEIQAETFDGKTPAQALSVNSNNSDDVNLRRENDNLKALLDKTKIALLNRERQVQSQELQISALTKQVSSLKEVVAITKDLLNIRTMEVKHLQEDVDKMETRLASERERHGTLVNKMESAVRLNADLKKEYELQLRLFQDLRGKYEEKVDLLNQENRALEANNNTPAVAQ